MGGDPGGLRQPDLRGLPPVTLKAAVKVCRRVSEIGREAWDACAGNPAYAGNPFIRYDFLHDLE